MELRFLVSIVTVMVGVLEAHLKEGCRALLEVCIVIDGSDSISFDDFQLLRDSVDALVEKLNIGPGQGRMGIVVYSRDIAMEIPLIYDKSALSKYAKNMPHPRDGTNTALGIERMKVLFQKSDRQDVPRIGIVVTDGISKDPSKTALEANHTKSLGVKMFAVGVGEFIDHTELAAIASSKEHVLMVDSFGTLAKDIGKLVKLICPVDCGEPINIPYATLLPGKTSGGSRRRYQCVAGTQVIGDTVIVCQANGLWTKHNFYCHVPKVPPPVIPQPIPTPVPKVPPPVIPQPIPTPGPCDLCKMQNGVGFNPHPKDCDKFIQCYFNEYGKVRASYRQCPFGQFWDHNALSCRPSEQVNCSKEKCRNYRLIAYAYGDRPNCRAHWKCNMGKSVSACCQLGFSFHPYFGCRKDPGCVDKCPPPTLYHKACDSRPSGKDRKGYQQFVHGFGWIDMVCPPGSRYDSNMCMCEYHASYVPGTVCHPEVHIPFKRDCNDHSDFHYKVKNYNVAITPQGFGYFNGIDSKLVIQHIDRMKNYNDLVIRIRYFDFPDRELRGMISNGDSYGPSLMTAKSFNEVHYMAKCNSSRVTSFTLPQMPGNWNELYYIHDGKRLEGKVNGLGSEMLAFGAIQNPTTGIQIGAVPGLKNFHGFIDEVFVFLCRPDFYQS